MPALASFSLSSFCFCSACRHSRQQAGTRVGGTAHSSMLFRLRAKRRRQRQEMALPPAGFPPPWPSSASPGRCPGAWAWRLQLRHAGAGQRTVLCGRQAARCSAGALLQGSRRRAPVRVFMHTQTPQRVCSPKNKRACLRRHCFRRCAASWPPPHRHRPVHPPCASPPSRQAPSPPPSFGQAR